MADTPSAALPETRVEEIRAEMAEMIAAQQTHVIGRRQLASIESLPSMRARRAQNGHPAMRAMPADPEHGARHRRILEIEERRLAVLQEADRALADRDRLQRRVEELEAANERVRRHLLDALVLLRDKANYETRQWAPQAMDLHDRAWSEVQGLIPTLAEVRALWNAEEPAALTSETPHAK